MNDFNPNTRLEQNAEKFEVPVSRLSNLFRSLTSFLATDVKIRGLDLSHWQADEKINFPVLKANGIDFVILKVTEGISFVDDTFKTKYTAALAAGLIVMPYHFFRSNYGGADQANHCIDTLRALGFFDAIEYIPVIWADVESSDGVSISTRRNRLLAFLQTIEEKGFQAGVYSSPGYWNELIGSVTWISLYWQCIAHWSWASSPTLPINWTTEKSKFWQNGIYPAHWWVEEVIGAEGNVDHNYFYGTLEDLKKFLKFPEVPPSGDCNCQDEISFLTSEIARLETEMNSNKLEIYILQQRDLAHDNLINQLNVAVIELTDFINENLVDLREEIEILGIDLEEVENALLAQSNLIETLESTISDQNSRIIALETLVSQLQGIFC